MTCLSKERLKCLDKQICLQKYKGFFSFVQAVPVRILSPLLWTFYYHVSTGVLWLRSTFILSFLSPTGSEFLILTFNPELIFSPLLKCLIKIHCANFELLEHKNENVFFHQIGNFSGALGIVNLRIDFEKSNVLHNIITQGSDFVEAKPVK